MNFKKYIENTINYVEDKDKVYCTLSLVSDTASLLEKLKYFKNENSLILAGIGDAIFSAFRLLHKSNVIFDEIPIDLEDLKLHVDELDSKYPISELDLQQTLVLELGIISNIITNYMKYNVEELTDDDKNRIKKSLYSYILYLMILICKYNFSIDRVLDFNIKKLEQNSKELNLKIMKDGD